MKRTDAASTEPLAHRVPEGRLWDLLLSIVAAYLVVDGVFTAVGRVAIAHSVLGCVSGLEHVVDDLRLRLGVAAGGSATCNSANCCPCRSATHGTSCLVVVVAAAALFPDVVDASSHRRSHVVEPLLDAGEYRRLTPTSGNVTRAIRVRRIEVCLSSLVSLEEEEYDSGQHADTGN